MSIVTYLRPAIQMKYCRIVTKTRIRRRSRLQKRYARLPRRPRNQSPRLPIGQQSRRQQRTYNGLLLQPCLMQPQTRQTRTPIDKKRRGRQHSLLKRELSRLSLRMRNCLRDPQPLSWPIRNHVMRSRLLYHRTQKYCRKSDLVNQINRLRSAPPRLLSRKRPVAKAASSIDICNRS
jgi:hypothetical protein